ncbi:MAG: hypothetical protein ACLFQV_04425, partial [Vulcanimicrobiota bacterium]
ALFAQAVMADERLNQNPQLAKAAGNHIEATMKHDQETMQMMAAAAPQGAPPMPGPARSEAAAPGGDNGAAAPPADGTAPADGAAPPPAGQHTEAAQKQKAQQDDLLQARTIYMEMAAERQKWMAKMWQILQDTQNAIMNIMQEVSLRRAATQDALAAKWAATLGGYG